MRNIEMLNRIYDAYNGYDVTLKEMYINAKNYIETIFQCCGIYYGQQEKYKFFTTFCAWIAASDGEINRKEYDFFISFSLLNVSFEMFKKIGREAINNKQISMELKDCNKNMFRSGTMYDYSANIIALCMCGCDGPINEKEREFLNNYIRHPDYNPL